jgi:hypothetical protein
MLSHCANLQCMRPFLRLRQGKLFLVETAGAPTSRLRPKPRRVDRYWLCDDCATVWTLIHDRHEGIVLAPLPRPPISPTVPGVEAYRDSA